jgi:hypothetical protein
MCKEGRLGVGPVRGAVGGTWHICIWTWRACASCDSEPCPISTLSSLRVGNLSRWVSRHDNGGCTLHLHLAMTHAPEVVYGKR